MPVSCRVVLERPYWTNEQILGEMTNLTQGRVMDFANNKLLKQLSVSCLAHGYVDSVTVSKASSSIR